MNRAFVSFPIASLQDTKSKLLRWAEGFEVCCLLDNHQYRLPHHRRECLLGAGTLFSVIASAGKAFDELGGFSELHKDWLFGHFGYDLKNEVEELSSGLPDRIGFPDLFFFVPEFVIEIRDHELIIGSVADDHASVFRSIMDGPPGSSPIIAAKKYGLRHGFSRDEYVRTVESIQKHMVRGDCYEMNFCQESFAEGELENPGTLYERLSAYSPAPFGAYYKLRDKYLLCASPERFLQKQADRLLTQPIKGTMARVPGDPRLDEKNRLDLLQSPKERSENIMIVDLVRNDLSRICREGTVEVEDLCQVHEFPQVFQLVSSVRGVTAKGTPWPEIIRAAFPMGSMTGAPKRRVMQLIEKYERSRRGLYSGALGYVTPERDFDFNVVIRSILLNTSRHQLSYSAGSAITFYSDPDREYQECLLKAKAIEKVLTG